MSGGPKDQYQIIPKVRYSRSSSKSSSIATPSSEIREDQLYRPDRLRGLRSKSHNSVKDGLPPRIWRRKHNKSPKNSAAALGIELNDHLPRNKDEEDEESAHRHKAMINIKAAMSNMSELWGHRLTATPSAKEDMSDQL
jgi:hypothetical protein